jgi:hypothetical protein
MIKITPSPNESSSMVIEVTFTNFDGALFTPKTCKWTLTDSVGTVINSRSRVSATVTTSTHEFLLQGEDLKFAITGVTDGNRVFTIEGTFDHALGTDIPFREQFGFKVIDTVLDAV